MTTEIAMDEFEILMEPDEDGFHVWCPALPGCDSFGLSKKEARENIREAIEGWLEAAVGLDIDKPERDRVKVARVEPSAPRSPATRSSARPRARRLG